MFLCARCILSADCCLETFDLGLDSLCHTWNSFVTLMVTLPKYSRGCMMTPYTGPSSGLKLQQQRTRHAPTPASVDSLHEELTVYHVNQGLFREMDVDTITRRAVRNNSKESNLPLLNTGAFRPFFAWQVRFLLVESKILHLRRLRFAEPQQPM